jgi:hypothetical protein
LLLATPGLRLGWLLCGWVRPELNHTPAILGVTTLLIPACLTAVLLWLSLGNKTPAGSYVSRYAPFLPWYRIGLTLNAIVALAMLWMTVLRFIPLASDWSTIDLAGSSADTQLFARAWPLYAVYWLACAAALLLVPHALRRALKRGDLSASFIVACTGTAVFGVLLNTVRGDAAPGGPSMAFFWYGLAVLWLIALARMIAGALAAQRSTTRDWAVVNVALALLPVSVLPSIPLWSIVADLDLDRAIVTAATASFALHYLVAHWFTTDVVVLKRKTPRARSALALGGATSAGA